MKKNILGPEMGWVVANGWTFLEDFPGGNLISN